MKAIIKKYGIVFIVSMAVFVATSCTTEDDLFEPAQTCSEVDAYFSQLIYDEAVAQGWDPTQFYELNTTNPFEPGYFDYYYDPNFAIYRSVMSDYLSAWSFQRNNLGCN